MIGYKIITKYSNNDKLVIYPIPKNANTSINYLKLLKAELSQNGRDIAVKFRAKSPCINTTPLSGHS